MIVPEINEPEAGQVLEPRCEPECLSMNQDRNTVLVPAWQE